MKVKMLTASASLAAVLCFNANKAQAAETTNQDNQAQESKAETQDNLKTSKANLEFRVQHLKETNGSKKAIDKLNAQIDRLDQRIIKKQKEETKEHTKQDEKKPDQKQEVKQEVKQEAPKAVNNVLSVTQNHPASQTPAPKVAAQVQQPQAPAAAAPTNSSARDTLVNKAKSLLGIPYVWGGTNPSSGLDCSGLTSFVYSQIGINIGRTTYDQDATGRHISLSELKPGDLILEYGKGHVAMYIGNGQQIEAPQPGESVKISPVPYAYGAMYGLSYVD